MKKLILVIGFLMISSAALAYEESPATYCSGNYSDDYHREEACLVGAVSAIGLASDKAECEIRYAYDADLHDVCTRAALFILMSR